MHRSTFRSILLLGTHANLYCEEFKEASGLPVSSLTFKKKNPFAVDEPHQFLFNEISIDFNGKYKLNELSFALSMLIRQVNEFDNCLVIGDPTELLYQAFCFAKNDQNPNFIRQEVQFKNEGLYDAFLFLYPCGMVAHNIRKEISSLVYLLKKYERNTFLVRDKEETTSRILQKMLKKSANCCDLDILEVTGIEKIISNETEFTS